jgi:subtilisin family serine protease
VAVAAAVVLVLLPGGSDDEPAPPEAPAAYESQTRTPDPDAAVAIPESPYLVIPTELVVLLAEDVTLDAFRDAIEDLPVSVVGFVEEFRVVQLELPEDRREEIKALLEADPLVRAVAHQVLFGPSATLNDPAFGNDDMWDDWHLKAIGAEAAWEVTRGDPGTVIAVIDDGVLIDHEELAGKIVAPYSIDNWEVEQQIDEKLGQHGTPVSTTAAGWGDNGVGSSGVCPNCSVMPIQAIFSANIYEAIAYAVEYGADVINMSIGPRSAGDALPLARDFHNPSTREQALLDGYNLGAAWSFEFDEPLFFAERHGVVVVVSAGNEATPGAFAGLCLHPLTLCVGAGELRVGGEILAASPFSNYGFVVDVAGPGGEVYTGSGAGPQEYTWFSGTSSAAPVVAGVAGLIRTAHPDLTARDIRQIIILSARTAGLSAGTAFPLYEPAARVEAEKRAYERALQRLLGLDETKRLDSFGREYLALLLPLEGNAVWLRPQYLPPRPSGLFAGDEPAPPPDPDAVVCATDEWDPPRRVSGRARQRCLCPEHWALRRCARGARHGCERGCSRRLRRSGGRGLGTRQGTRSLRARRPGGPDPIRRHLRRRRDRGQGLRAAR